MGISSLDDCLLTMKMGKGVLNIPLRGLEILNRGGVPSYSPIEIEKRNFEPKMYLYPIPQGDLDIAGWSQNPLW